MALNDDPAGWILLMFRKEEQEGRGNLCQRYSDGIEPDGLQLANGERIFGVYRNTYYFSPLALHVANGTEFTRIAWADVVSCSTKHGDGNETSILKLRDGSTATVRTADLATGWSGRTSQLYHQMIETFGYRASLGPKLRPLSDFLASASDDYSIFPNLEPHPRLDSLCASLNHLAVRDGVAEVRVIVPSDDPDTAVGLAIRSNLANDDLKEWVLSHGGSGLVAASENIARQFEPIADGQRILHAVWD